MSAEQGRPRHRGGIRERGGVFQVRVYVGTDPVTGERVDLTGTASSRRDAEKLLTRFLAEKDTRRAAQTKASLGEALDQWLAGLDVEAKTAHEYAGYIRRTIKPALGSVPLAKLDARGIESLYAQLRGCRRLCHDARGLTDHRTTREHTCDARCRPHECRPMAPATVRTVHAILSGTLRMGMRYGWLSVNPAEQAVRPRVGRPRPQPPTPEEAVRLTAAAFDQDDEWGVLVWLTMVTGMRRSELAALRWRAVDLDGARIEVSAGYVVVNGEGIHKDTKTHQMRYVRLDAETAGLLAEHRERCHAQLDEMGVQLDGRHFVFSASPDRSAPRSPDGISTRYRRMAAKLGVDTHIHALRHYSATELITAGVDLRTVAGRLGHGDGTTTLRVYAAWVAATGDHAADVMATRMPRRSPR